MRRLGLIGLLLASVAAAQSPAPADEAPGEATGSDAPNDDTPAEAPGEAAESDAPNDDAPNDEAGEANDDAPNDDAPNDDAPTDEAGEANDDAPSQDATAVREPGARGEDGDEPTLPDAARPRLSVEISPREGVVTGDVVHVVLRADARKDDDLAIPRDQEFAPFDVLDRRVRVEERGDRAVHVFELDLLALEPGDHTIGPLRVRVVTAEGQVGEVRSSPIEVSVGSVLGNEPDAEPKPPTDPVQVWQDDYTLLWVLGALGLVGLTALLTLLLARWWRRRQREAAPPPPPRPAWEVALERLEELRRDREAAVAEGRVVEWVDGVSDAVRDYLGQRYGFEGLESTTDEVLRELEGKALVGVDRSEVAALLHDCDLVKFAKATLDAEQCDALLAGAFRIVRASAPRPGSAATPPQAPDPSAGPPPGSPLATAPAAGPPAATPPGDAPPPPPADPDARWMPPGSASTGEVTSTDTAAALPPTRELPATEATREVTAPDAALPRTREVAAAAAPAALPPTREVAAAAAPAALPPTREVPLPSSTEATSPGEEEPRPIPATRPPPVGADTLPETVLGVPRTDAPEEPEGTS